MSPRPRKLKHPDLEDTLDEVYEANRDLAMARGDEWEAEQKRRTAVILSLEQGATLKELGALLGMSAEGVRRITMAAPRPNPATEWERTPGNGWMTPRQPK